MRLMLRKFELVNSGHLRTMWVSWGKEYLNITTGDLGELDN